MGTGKRVQSGVCVWCGGGGGGEVRNESTGWGVWWGVCVVGGVVGGQERECGVGSSTRLHVRNSFKLNFVLFYFFVLFF